VSPEWPKPQTAESRVSEKKTRDSLVTRRAYSDPTERVPNTVFLYCSVHQQQCYVLYNIDGSRNNALPNGLRKSWSSLNFAMML